MVLTTAETLMVKSDEPLGNLGLLIHVRLYCVHLLVFLATIASFLCKEGRSNEIYTICPSSSYTFYKVSCYITWVITIDL